MNLTTVFFSEPSLKRILTYLCNTRAPGSWDPVTATVLDLLTGKLQFCLSSIGLIPLKGHANLVYPYHMIVCTSGRLQHPLTEGPVHRAHLKGGAAEAEWGAVWVIDIEF